MDPSTQADAPPSQELSPQVKLAKSLFDAATAAFDPASKKSPEEIQEARAEFQNIIDR